jgi:hypothetical protein
MNAGKKRLGFSKPFIFNPCAGSAEPKDIYPPLNQQIKQIADNYLFATGFTVSIMDYGYFSHHLRINVIDLKNRFIARAEAPLLDAVFPWIFSAWPDEFNGHDEQAV